MMKLYVGTMRVWAVTFCVFGLSATMISGASDDVDGTNFARFSAPVQATAVKGQDGKLVDISAYETGKDALAAGNFAAYIAMKDKNILAVDAPSHNLGQIALGVDAYLRDAPYQVFFDAIPNNTTEKQYADKVTAWLLALDGEADAAIAALVKANGERISVNEEMGLAAMLESLGREEQALAIYSTLIPKEIRTPRNDFDFQNYLVEQYQTIIARQASLLRAMGRVEDAKAAYEILIKSDPENAARYRGYVTSMDNGDDAPEVMTPVEGFALIVADMAAADYRGRMIAANQMGQRLTNFDERYAVLLHLALMLDPVSESRRIAVAEQLINKRLFEGAAHILETATEKSARINIGLAETYLKLLRVDDSRKAVQASLMVVEPEDRRMIYASAMSIYSTLGDRRRTQRLAHQLQALIDDAPNQPALYTTLAYAYRNIGKMRKAIANMEKAVELDDSHSRRMALWSMMGEADMIEAGEKGMRRELLSRLDDPYMLNSLGYYLAVYTTKYNEAYKLLMRADAIAEDNPFITDSLGWVYYRLGYLDRARVMIERSREVYLPNLMWEVEDHLADIYWHEGDKEKARKFWKSALEQYPPLKQRSQIKEKLRNGLDESKPEKQDLPRVNLDQGAEEEKDI